MLGGGGNKICDERADRTTEVTGNAELSKLLPNGHFVRFLRRTDFPIFSAQGHPCFVSKRRKKALVACHPL